MRHLISWICGASHPLPSRFQFALVTAGLFFHPLRATADYDIALLSQGQSAARVQVGNAIQLDLVLASTTSDRHSSAVLRIEFSASGLRYDSYFWTLPFSTGGEDDASVPPLASLPLILQPATVSAAATATGTVDIYLSNLLPGVNSFASGKLAQIRLTIPTDYVGPDTITIQPVVEGFADGFRTIRTANPKPFQLTVAPSSGAVQPALQVSIDGTLATLSWSAAIQDAVVESTSNLADPTSWVPLSSTPITENGRHTLLVPAGSSALPSFFRLHFK